MFEDVNIEQLLINIDERIFLPVNKKKKNGEMEQAITMSKQTF